MHAVCEEALLYVASPTKHTCPTCGLVCKLAGGFNWHSKMPIDVPQPVISNNGKFKCMYVCMYTCR